HVRALGDATPTGATRNETRTAALRDLKRVRSGSVITARAHPNHRQPKEIGNLAVWSYPGPSVAGSLDSSGAARLAQPGALAIAARAVNGALRPMDRASLIAQVRASYETPAALAAYRERVDNGLRTWEETVVANHFPEAGRVLTVGCGAGRETFALER